MLISTSGKINSGKDTIGKILQILLNNPHLNNEGVLSFLKKDINFDSPYYKTWQIKKFADKLKDIVCILLGCTREQLEDREFKEKELGEEWTCYKVTQLDKIINKCYLIEKEALTFIEYASKYYFKEGVDKLEHFKVIKVNMTPRLLLQLVGTECGRQILHPNIWCNSLMSEYKGDLEEWKPIKNYEDSYEVSSYGNVRSLDRNIIYGENKGENHNRKGVILKPTLSGGYFTVSLKGKTHTVHSLVGEVFLNKSDNDFVLNHIDYNKQNNFYKNLEYVSQGDNVRHNYAVGKANIGENQKDAKLDVDKVIAIRKLLEEGTLSQNRIAKLFEVSPTTITDIKKGRKWNHVGREIPTISPIIPNWIITDTRFENELKAVKDRGGITIRVNRFKEKDKVYWTDPDTTEFAEGASSGVYSIIKLYDEFCLLSNAVGSEAEVPYHEIKLYIEDQHESETALDNAEFDYVIQNDGTLEDLIDKVREIIVKEKL